MVIVWRAMLVVVMRRRGEEMCVKQVEMVVRVRVWTTKVVPPPGRST